MPPFATVLNAGDAPSHFVVATRVGHALTLACGRGARPYRGILTAVVATDAHGRAPTDQQREPTSRAKRAITECVPLARTRPGRQELFGYDTDASDVKHCARVPPPQAPDESASIVPLWPM